MRLKTLFFTLSAIISLQAFGSDRIYVDLNRIEVEMTMNPSEYRQLFDRFVAADTTLTTDEIAKIYYGQGFTVDYDPNATFPLITEAYKRQDYSTVASLADAILDENPLSLDLLVMGLVAATREARPQDHKVALKLQRRLDMLINTIIATGTGTSSQSPFYIASTEDLRQFLKNVLGVSEIIDVSKVGTGDVEAYKVRLPGSDREHILYFNNALQHRYDNSHKRR